LLQDLCFGNDWQKSTHTNQQCCRDRHKVDTIEDEPLSTKCNENDEERVPEDEINFVV
jgi:hypothetical protein